MRRAWLALPVLVLLSGCQMLDPALAYQEAARKLTIRLERVEPNLELAFPLERTRLRLRLTLMVENPSELRLRTRSIGGRIFLDSGGGSRSISTVEAPRGLDLAPGARTPVILELSLAYADLQEAYGPLRSVILDGKSGTWRLEGQMNLDVMGIGLVVPIRSSKHVGK
jgi:hypothetical protein